MKVIIDVDPGIDDSYALTLASMNDDVEILAVTIVHGNTNIDNASINAKLVLDKIYPKNKNQPPIYLGAYNPLVKLPNNFYFHHEDGLAGTHQTIFKEEVENIKETFLKDVKSINAPHAANKIIELVNQYPNEITIIALGPLTNIALALRMSHDPINFSKNIKKLVIMGGNEPKNFSNETIPNHSNYPEFNFRTDPIAAKIVLDGYLCPITIYTYEFCIRSFAIKTDLLIEEFNKYVHKSKRCHFIESFGILHRLASKNPTVFTCCDLVAMIGCFYGSECNAIYKDFNDYTIECKNGDMDGLFLKRVDTIKYRNENVELCIKLDQNCAYDIFKKLLNKLEVLDNMEF